MNGKLYIDNINRLYNKAIIKKDDYRNGGYIKVLEVEEYDFSGVIDKDEIQYNVKLPLNIHSQLIMKPIQLFQVSGRYDAGN